jgi:hypothetical protein
MDALLSAVASDLIGRLVSFVIGKYQERGAADTAVRLHRVLLRARVIVEESEGRQIADRAMLQQLSQLRRELFRASYALDSFRLRDRRSRPHTRPDVLSGRMGSLEAALSNMREFVVHLGACPRVTKQPYSTYLFMQNYMFGRQLEKQQIIAFLLQPSSQQDLDVLPIVGPHEVGKRTLVEHVCLDERVRERFAKVHRLRSDALDLHIDEDDRRSMFDFTARLLVVIDMVDDDLDAEETWRRFYSAVRRHAHGGSKIIVISRTEAHSSLGTVPPLRLRPLRREELWYFFRALAFGAVDPDQHPDLARIAMAMCSEITQVALFAAANVVAESLRADLSARSWRRVLKVFDGAKVLPLGAAGDWFNGDKTGICYLRQPVTDTAAAPLVYYIRRTGVARSELPKVTMMELLAGGSIPPAGETRFDMLVWKTRIPPYVSYVATCDMERARHVVRDEKRGGKRLRDQQDNYASNESIDELA